MKTYIAQVANYQYNDEGYYTEGAFDVVGVFSTEELATTFARKKAIEMLFEMYDSGEDNVASFMYDHNSCCDDLDEYTKNMSEEEILNLTWDDLPDNVMESVVNILFQVTEFDVDSPNQ